MRKEEWGISKTCGFVDTGSDISEHLQQGLDVSGWHMGGELPFQNGIFNGAVAKQHQDVSFVECGAVNLPLAVERGQRKEFEQNDALRGGATQTGSHEVPLFSMVFRDMGEKRIGGEQQIDAEGACVTTAKPFIAFAQDKAGEPFKILDGDNEIDVAGIPSVDVLQHGEPANENVRDFFPTQ